MTDSHRVSVIGAGIMGHGLAVQFAIEGRDVTLIDHRRSNLENARQGIRDAVSFLAEEGLTGAEPTAVVDDIEFTLDDEAGVAHADVVLETVSEDLDVKHEVFRTAAAAAPGDAVLATNTSGIPITDVARGVPDAAERVVGCHWWNPPYLMPLVEVTRGAETADEVVERTAAFVESVGRDPVMVQRDVPGFVWNRIQFAVLRECLHLVSSGVASLDDVNRAVRDGYARRTAVIGPFETVDLSGLALFEAVAEELYPHLCDDDDPGDLFGEYRSRGRGGVEDGAGFFEYDAPPGEVARRRDEGIAALSRALGRAGE